MAFAERIVVALLDDSSIADDAAHGAQVVGNVIIYQIGTAALEDAATSEGNAFESLAAVVNEGAEVVVSGGAVHDTGLGAVGQIGVAGLGGTAGCGGNRYRLPQQVVGQGEAPASVRGQVAVGIVCIGGGSNCGNVVSGVGIREGRSRAGGVVAGQGGDVAVAVVGDALLREGVGGRGVAVVLPGSEAVGPVVGEAVGVRDGCVSASVGPGPTADVAGILRGGAGEGRGVVAQGHGEDVRRSLEGRARGQPALDVPGVGGDARCVPSIRTRRALWAGFRSLRPSGGDAASSGEKKRRP